MLLKLYYLYLIFYHESIIITNEFFYIYIYILIIIYIHFYYNIHHLLLEYLYFIHYSFNLHTLI